MHLHVNCECMHFHNVLILTIYLISLLVSFFFACEIMRSICMHAVGCQGELSNRPHAWSYHQTDNNEMNTEKLKRFLTGLVVGLGIAALILSANATRPEVSKHMFHMILFIPVLPPSRCVSHLTLCTATKAKRKTRKLNIFLLINSIACNELTTACHVW